MFIAHDSSTTIELGTYTLAANGSGEFLVVRSFENTWYDSTVSVLDPRRGARFNDDPMPKSYVLSVEGTAEEIVVGLDGERRRLANLADVIGAIDPATEAGAKHAYQLMTMSLYSSQSRISGFGGRGMTSYKTKTVFLGMAYSGTATNESSIWVKSNLDPNATMSYYGFQDLNGIVLDGVQFTDITNLSGDGLMSGELTIALTGRDAMGSPVVLDALIDYATVEVHGGLADGGNYTFSVNDGPAVLIPAGEAYAMDLRSLLPPSTP
ncbi:MAG: hypothetical protein H5U40_01455 [Polyangiaceae bacterium]|nr:hypothetical protein [Polyangiaceae bacterium]